MLSPSFFRAFVEALLEDEQTWFFVMTKCVSDSVVPLDLFERIERNNKGICVGWAPQREALTHEAVGLMKSHAGTGGAIEAISCSVPLLCWPLIADQPATAKLLSSPLHSVALELIQVRTGPGAQDSLAGGKIYGTPEAVKIEVLERLNRFRGEEGEISGGMRES